MKIIDAKQKDAVAELKRIIDQGESATEDVAATMREVVERSLRRDLGEAELPDLVVIDGGKGQLAAACEGRDAAGAEGVRLVGLAKARAGKGPLGEEERAAIDSRTSLSSAASSVVMVLSACGRLRVMIATRPSETNLTRTSSSGSSTSAGLR